jgi:hypothetical protein
MLPQYTPECRGTSQQRSINKLLAPLGRKQLGRSINRRPTSNDACREMPNDKSGRPKALSDGDDLRSAPKSDIEETVADSFPDVLDSSGLRKIEKWVEKSSKGKALLQYLETVEDANLKRDGEVGKCLIFCSKPYTALILYGVITMLMQSSIWST